MKTNIPRTSKGMSRGQFIQAGVATVAFAAVLPASLLAEGADIQNEKIGARMNQEKIITSRLDEAERYFGLHASFKKAFEFLRQSGLSKLAPGKHVIDGDRMFCLITKGPGKTRADAKLEGHRRYIDIQYIIAGTDEMGCKPTAACQTVDQPYDTEKDIVFYKDKPESWTKVPSGSFIIFYPRDAHAPLVSDGEIHKAVVKIAMV